MPKPHLHLWVGLAALFLTTACKTKPSSEATRYTTRSNTTYEALHLLPNGRFTYAFAGGLPGRTSEGTWTIQQDSLELKSDDRFRWFELDSITVLPAPDASSAIIHVANEDDFGLPGARLIFRSARGNSIVQYADDYGNLQVKPSVYKYNYNRVDLNYFTGDGKTISFKLNVRPKKKYVIHVLEGRRSYDYFHNKQPYSRRQLRSPVTGAKLRKRSEK